METFLRKWICGSQLGCRESSAGDGSMKKTKQKQSIEKVHQCISTMLNVAIKL